MAPEDRFVPRFAAEPPQDLLPYGRWAQTLTEHFVAAVERIDAEGEDLGEPGDVVFLPPHLARADVRAGHMPDHDRARGLRPRRLPPRRGRPRAVRLRRHGRLHGRDGRGQPGLADRPVRRGRRRVARRAGPRGGDDAGLGSPARRRRGRSSRASSPTSPSTSASSSRAASRSWPPTTSAATRSRSRSSTAAGSSSRESLYDGTTTRTKAEVELEEAIRTRRTHKAYGAEPVDRATLRELLDLARWAPNHNLTNPWRFRVLGPGALARLKDAAGPRGRRQARPRADPRRRLGRAVRRPGGGRGGPAPRPARPTSCSSPPTAAGSPPTGARRPSCARRAGARRSAAAGRRAVGLLHLGPRRARLSASPSARRPPRSWPSWTEAQAAAVGTRSAISSSVSGKWQAAMLPPSLASSSGSSRRSRSWAFGQRVWKRQAGGGLAGRGTSPAEQLALLLAREARVGHRHRRQQRAGVRVARVRVERRRPSAELDDLAEVHDRDAVAHVAHDARGRGR